MDQAVTINERDPNKYGPYVVSIQRTIEPDALVVRKEGDPVPLVAVGAGTTLYEYLLFQLGFLVTTGELLDQEDWTLCTGSRCTGPYFSGLMPGLTSSREEGVIFVGWWFPCHELAFSWLRPRFAFVPKTQSLIRLTKNLVLTG